MTISGHIADTILRNGKLRNEYFKPKKQEEYDKEQSMELIIKKNTLKIQLYSVYASSIVGIYSIQKKTTPDAKTASGWRTILRPDNTIRRSNTITLEADKILADLWSGNFEGSLHQVQTIFDEKKPMRTSTWLSLTLILTILPQHWSVRDYGDFVNGRCQKTAQLV